MILFRKRELESGFTLVEVAISLVIIGILLSGATYIFGSQYQLRKGKEVQRQLSDIKQSLLTYVKVNGYLPCPDKLQGNHSRDGYEDRKNDGSCSVREGLLPSQTIGVNGKDPWNQPFYFRVNARAEDLNRVIDICQSASVFGAIKSGGVARKKDSDFALCPDNNMYYCRGCSSVCSSLCDFDADPRPYTDLPPYFHTSTPPIGAEDDGFKNLTILNEAGDVVADVQVAVVVSFGSNGIETWGDGNHCPNSLSANEKENCDNDQVFVMSQNQSLNDFVIGISLRDVKRAFIETGIKDY